jgi:methionyl-tRNA formyltransferase
LRGEEFAALLDSLAPDAIVVAAYGKILPKNVLGYPKYGCINVHGSLLPEYRGAAPIQHAIIDGKSETGITIMYMAEGLDTGDMILKKTAPIYENDNFEVIHDRLGLLGSEALMEALSMIKNGTAERVPQDESLSNYAAKIEKSDCLLDFSLDARTLHNKIRGLSPIPLAFTHTPDGKLLKIVASAVVENEKAHENAGEIIALDGAIRVACGKGTLDILTLLPEGKGRMSAADFIRGRKVNVGDILK